MCRKWRHIVFTSQQALHLRLFCSSGTPVSETLDCWPPLPIVLEYGGSLALDPPSPEDELNIIAAFKRSDRVSSISLTITTSLLHKLLYMIKKPFLELEDLIILSRDSVLTLPTSFLWGPRLRRLHLTRIALPPLLQLLSSSRNLVDLRLHEVLKPRYYLIEELTELTNALSGMVQLQSLSLHFLFTGYYLPPPRHDRRIDLPALTHLSLRGSAKFLERLILSIDAPRLKDTQVTVDGKLIYNFSKLGEFVNRIEINKSHHQLHILSSEDAISISLTQPRDSTCFKLQLLSWELDSQLFAMSYILRHFSAFLLNVEDLRISVTQTSSQEDSLCSERWLGLLKLFTGVKWLHLDGIHANHSTAIVRALREAHRQHKTVRSALHKLYLPHTPHHAPLSEAVVSFMASFWRSGSPIGVEYGRTYSISEQHGRGTSLSCPACASTVSTY